jgi:hypothetical protein
VSEKEGERVRKREREREREREYGCFILILKGMTGALASLSYLIIFRSKHIKK